MVACGGWIVSQAFDLGCKNRPFRPGSSRACSAIPWDSPEVVGLVVYGRADTLQAPKATVGFIGLLGSTRVHAPDKRAHQRGAFRRMGLEQKMRTIENVCLHAGERLHPGEGLLECEEGVVPPP